MDDTNATINPGVNNSNTQQAPAAGTVPLADQAEMATPQASPALTANTPTPTSPALEPAIAGEQDLTPPAPSEPTSSAPAAPAVEPAISAPAPEMPTPTPPTMETSSINMELGPREQEATNVPPAAENPAPVAAEPIAEPELNIPPEIAAAKANVQSAAGMVASGATAAEATKRSPLLKIIIIAAAVLVLAGGYFAYQYFVKSKSGSASTEYFISE